MPESLQYIIQNVQWRTPRPMKEYKYEKCSQEKKKKRLPVSDPWDYPDVEISKQIVKE